MPVGQVKLVKDFLPPPSALVFPSDTVKITIALKKSSIAFFKRQATKHHTKYQRMIRELLDKYAELHSTA